MTITNELGMIQVNVFNADNLTDMSTDIGVIDVNIESSDKLEIFDFRVKNVNSGYGSAMISALLEYIDSFKYDQVQVVGYLSEIDEKDSLNCTRRDHVYEKFGFTKTNRRVKKFIVTRQGRMKID